MSWMKDDPRSEAERARADLKRNTEMAGEAPTLSPVTGQPSVTPATFGETHERAHMMAGTDTDSLAGGGDDNRSESRDRLGDQDPLAQKDPSGKRPGADNDPGRGGYYHADTRMGSSHSEEIADFERTITGAPEAPDAMNRGKE